MARRIDRLKLNGQQAADAAYKLLWIMKDYQKIGATNSNASKYGPQLIEQVLKALNIELEYEEGEVPKVKNEPNYRLERIGGTIHKV